MNNISSFSASAKAGFAVYKKAFKSNKKMMIMRIICAAWLPFTHFIHIMHLAEIIEEAAGKRDPDELTFLVLNALITAAVLSFITVILYAIRDKFSVGFEFKINKLFCDKLYNCNFALRDSENSEFLLCRGKKDINEGTGGVSKIIFEFEKIISSFIMIVCGIIFSAGFFSFDSAENITVSFSLVALIVFSAVLFSTVKNNELNKSNILNALILSFFSGVLLCTCGLKAVKGDFGAGIFTLYIATLFEIFSGLSRLFASLLFFKKNNELSNKILVFLDDENLIRKGKIKIDSQSLENFEFEFINVGFKYCNSDDFVFKNINFKITKGERINISFDSDRGKKELIQLILRLYEPTEGKILFNGVNISEYDFDDYIKLFALYSNAQADKSKLILSAKTENVNAPIIIDTICDDEAEEIKCLIDNPDKTIISFKTKKAYGFNFKAVCLENGKII